MTAAGILSASDVSLVSAAFSSSFAAGAAATAGVAASVSVATVATVAAHRAPIAEHPQQSPATLQPPPWARTVQLPLRSALERLMLPPAPPPAPPSHPPWQPPL